MNKKKTSFHASAMFVSPQIHKIIGASHNPSEHKPCPKRLECRFVANASMCSWHIWSASQRFVFKQPWRCFLWYVKLHISLIRGGLQRIKPRPCWYLVRASQEPSQWKLAYKGKWLLLLFCNLSWALWPLKQDFPCAGPFFKSNVYCSSYKES